MHENRFNPYPRVIQFFLQQSLAFLAYRTHERVVRFLEYQTEAHLPVFYLNILHHIQCHDTFRRSGVFHLRQHVTYLFYKFLHNIQYVIVRF